MFYDETGKHVRTKKEILDDSSQIRAGCKVVPKGDVYERNLFTTTDSKFKGEKFLEDVKHSYMLSGKLNDAQSSALIRTVFTPAGCSGHFIQYRFGSLF